MTRRCRRRWRMPSPICGPSKRSRRARPRVAGWRRCRWTHKTAMQIALVGATGVLGRHLIPQLLAQGHNVRALVRDPTKAAALVGAGVALVPGDLLDPNVPLGELLTGCDAAAHIATAIPPD